MKLNLSVNQLKYLRKVLGPTPAFVNGVLAGDGVYDVIAAALDDVEARIQMKQEDITAYKKMIDKLQAEIKELS